LHLSRSHTCLQGTAPAMALRLCRGSVALAAALLSSTSTLSSATCIDYSGWADRFVHKRIIISDCCLDTHHASDQQTDLLSQSSRHDVASWRLGASPAPLNALVPPLYHTTFLPRAAAGQQRDTHACFAVDRARAGTRHFCVGEEIFDC
jgi:hypothetical protein